MAKQTATHNRTNRTERNRSRKREARFYHAMLAVPVLLLFIYHFLPVPAGILMAFENFQPGKGFFGSQFVGFRNFRKLFLLPDTLPALRNTLVIAVEKIVCNIVFPVTFALLLNEVRVKWVKRAVQTITYLPYFLSTVVVCGFITNIVASDGLINQILKTVGMEPVTFLMEPQWFRPIYVISELWQGCGWGSIIYLAALAGVDQQLYEAASIDGASKLQQLIHISLPGIVSVISVQFLLTVGRILSIGYEKIILLYNGSTYKTADVISTYVYRRGLIEANYSYGAAVSIFQSVIALFLVVMANKAAKKVGQTSLW